MAKHLRLKKRLKKRRQRLLAAAVASKFLKPRDRGLWKGDANALVRF
jgi:hypothetical protein